MEIIHLSFLLMLCFGVHRSTSEVLLRQKRNWIIESFDIDEAYQGPFPYSLGTIQLENNVRLFKLHGQGVDEEPKGVLEIDQNTGEITVHRAVNYEEFQKFTVTFQAYKQDHEVDTRLGIEIKILDANDNAPQFDQQIYRASIQESTVQGTILITISATDKDAQEENKYFDFRIVSVTPEPTDLEFYLMQKAGKYTGNLSFKGCLDHEKASKYTIIVEAKDQGKKVQLSSSCTVIIDIDDGNNHLPEIIQDTGPRRVSERQVNVLVSQLQVKDEDTKGTAAWRAKYEIHGDEKGIFRITTDPQTNDGLLYVEKPLDYEEESIKNVTITVENEIPYYSCRVEQRRTTGLWKVVTVSGATMTGTKHLYRASMFVIVTVEDVNEAPVFAESNMNVKLSENVKVGEYLVTVTAKDPDVTGGNTFVYTKGHDPAGWVSVDSNTGIVTTLGNIDREEGAYVKDNFYVVTIYAVDDGKPPETGTATLSIHVDDENDNTPTLVESTFDMCQSDRPSLAKITASDLDDDPYSGPFNFKLHGDVEGKWAVNPQQGHSVNLVKEQKVVSGHFELMLEVSDLQGNRAFHNISVTVCTCFDPTTPNCRLRKLPTITLGAGGVLAALFCCAFAGVLLMGICHREKTVLPEIPDTCEQSLNKTNTETPGTDCDVESHWNKIQKPIQYQIQCGTIKPGVLNSLVSTDGHQDANDTHATKQSWLICNSAREGSQVHGEYQNSAVSSFYRNSIHRGTVEQRNFSSGYNQQQMLVDSNIRGSQRSAQYSNGSGFFHKSSMDKMLADSKIRGSQCSAQYSNGSAFFHKSSMDKAMVGYNIDLLAVHLNKMVCSLQAQDQELGDYEPHVYAEEGESGESIELDAISITDVPFDLDQDLDLKFSDLAAICMSSGSAAIQLNEQSFTYTTEIWTEN